MHIFSKLDAFEQERSARLAHPKLSQYPTPFKINVGKLNAGVWPSSVPDLAVMEIRYGMSPNETVETAKAEFEAFIEQICSEDPWLSEHRPELEWLGTCWHPISVDENEELIQLVNQNMRLVRKRETEITGIACTADGAMFSRYLGVPSVLVGPGELPEAHQVNESVSISETVDACKVIAATILNWCGYES